MVIREKIGKEFLPEESSNGLVGLIHPGGYDREVNEFTYDRNEKSTAYIPYGEGRYYYAGGLNGGRTPAFLKMSETLRDNTEEDKRNGVMALWHDESHINRYLDHPPYSLTPAYCYPEGWNMPFPQIILLLDKSFICGGHKYLRGGKRNFHDYTSYLKRSLVRFARKVIGVLRGFGL